MAKKMLWSEEFEKEVAEKEADPNTDIERRLAAQIDIDIRNAEVSKGDNDDDTGLSIEEQWEDEYKLLRGGGLQWTTNLAYRNLRDRKRRPNSEDNFIHTAIGIQTANITASIPEVRINGRKKHEAHAQKLTHMARYNDYRNRFIPLWKEMVRDFISYGPLIAEVCWNPEIIGGAGPDRFIGDVEIKQIPKEDMLFDPAILDLERDLQKSRFCGYRNRVFVKYVQKRWEKFANTISYESNDDPLIDEGNEHESVYLYKMYYKGFPEYMPDDVAKSLRERAATQEEQGDIYKARDLYDMAKGEVEGVHVAYYCNDVLLEYTPYIYDNGKYPFAFTTRYKDLKNQWGYGEIRNIKIPQLLHNKADEIEIEAMVKEGLGGGYYEVGAMTPRQLDNILDNGGRSGMWFGVSNLNAMKERTGVKVPASITNYKEHKQRMVETVATNPAISQGMMPSANAPFKAIQSLGSRVDIKTKAAADKLKDFLVEINKLRIDLFAQFYTEERYYRYTDSQKNVYEGTFRNDEIFDVWSRETEMQEVTDPITGETVEQPVERLEYYVPDFDIDVTIISKKPDDRDYYTNLAFHLHSLGIMTEADLLYTLDEGRMPDSEEILSHMAEANELKGIMADVNQLPEQVKPQVIQGMKQSVQDTVGQIMNQMQMQGQPQPMNQQLQGQQM